MAARGLMCLALVLGLLAAAASAQDRFEDIARQAWERHQAYLADGVYKSNPDAPAAARTHKCVHSELMNERTRQARFRELRKRQDPSSPAYREAMAAKRSVRQTTPQPIRFFSDTRLLDSTTDSSTCYTAGSVVDSYQMSGQTVTCNSNALVTDSVRNYLKLTVIPTTVSMFQSLLRVTPRTGNLVVGVTDLCSDLAASFATSVPNADYYMFFSARAVLDSGTIATAETCSTDPTDGHPFVGLVNFNPASFQSMPSNYFDFQYALRVAMHEFTHALGFSTGLYSSYRNSSGLPYPALTFPMSGSVYTGIATPRVLNWARNYFNCPTLSAMPLEDDGGAGTQGSHWEQKAVYSEYMVGIATQFFAISNLTLNLLADSGWYTPDFSKAEDLGFGWQKGCQFLALPCTDANWNVLGPTEAYECSGTSRGCTADRLAVGVCTATVSSQSLTMPGCNFYSTQSPATFCQANGTEADGVIGDFYCPQCRCFSVRNAATSTAAACFQVQCVAGTNGTQLRVQKGNTWHDCPADGSAGTIRVGSSVPGIDTTIYCPASIEICRQVSIDSARLVPYKKKTGFKWLFTNNSFYFWGMVAGVLIVGMIAICLFMCLFSTLCSCICGGNKGPRNRALMLRR